jgi:F-type H+-transporting ATPase subunit epsilon
MSEELFNFELVTPEKVIVSGSVSSVSIAGVEGDMTIYSNHSPIATAIKPGYIDINSDSKSERYFLTGGFVQITGSDVVVLSEKASLENEVNLEMIDKEINRTKSSMEKATDLQRCVLSKKLNDLTIIKNQL